MIKEDERKKEQEKRIEIDQDINNIELQSIEIEKQEERSADQAQREQ